MRRAAATLAPLLLAGCLSTQKGCVPEPAPTPVRMMYIYADGKMIAVLPVQTRDTWTNISFAMEPVVTNMALKLVEAPR